MWARVKGKTENDLKKLPFKSVYLFRPGLMKPVEGQKNLKRYQKVAGLLYALLKPISPKNVCKLEDVGLAMIHAVEVGYPKQVLENMDITQLAQLN